MTKAAYVVLDHHGRHEGHPGGCDGESMRAANFGLNVLNDLQIQGSLNVYLFARTVCAVYQAIQAVFPQSCLQRCIDPSDPCFHPLWSAARTSRK